MASIAAPMGPPRRLVGGNIAELGRDQLGFFARCAREYGDFVPLRFATTRALFINRAEYIEEVLVTRNRSFVKGYGVRRMSSLIGNGLLSSEGDFWRRQRRLAQPAFHRQRVAAYGETMTTYAERATADWKPGEVRDLQDEMMRLTLQIAAKTLFDADVAAAVAEVDRASTAVLKHFGQRFGSMLLLVPDRVPTPANVRYLAAVRRLERIVYQLIEERRRTGRDGDDLLSQLVLARDEDGRPMTDRQLRDEVMTLLLAGHETTALALSWAWCLLSQHPAAEMRMHSELDAVIADRIPTVADLDQLPYTEAVVNEALRLYPPAWVIGRDAAEDTMIGAHSVRRRTAVLFSPWVIHRDGRYFEDPEAFRPERWLDGLAKRLPRGAFIPFGGGPRLCIGAPFAMMEAVLLLATIGSRLSFALVPDHRVEPIPSVTLRHRFGLKMVVHRREHGAGSPATPSPLKATA